MHARAVMSALLVAGLSACQTEQGRLYEGPERPRDEVACLYRSKQVAIVGIRPARPIEGSVEEWSGFWFAGDHVTLLPGDYFVRLHWYSLLVDCDGEILVRLEAGEALQVAAEVDLDHSTVTFSTRPYEQEGDEP